MDNTERLATLSTQNEDKEHSSERKIMSNTDPQKSEDEPRCSIIINTTVKIRIIDMLSDIKLFQTDNSTSTCIHIYLICIPNPKYTFTESVKQNSENYDSFENICLHSRLVLILNMPTITTFCVIFVLRNHIHFNIQINSVINLKIYNCGTLFIRNPNTCFQCPTTHIEQKIMDRKNSKVSKSLHDLQILI